VVDTMEERKNDAVEYILKIGNKIRFDVFRGERRGFPEVVYFEGKSVEECAEIIKKVVDTGEKIIISRIGEDDYIAVKSKVRGIESRYSREGRIASFYSKPYGYVLHGVVAVVSAGTSDVPYCEEAAFVCEEMGCKVLRIYDVGVAAIHRPVDAAAEIKKKNADVAIISAGMDGVLPTIMASMLDIPVIGLPTPVGYGVAKNGIVALQTMLSSCVPGVAVVNVGNGVGAGALACLIVKRINDRVASAK